MLVRETSQIRVRARVAVVVAALVATTALAMPAEAGSPPSVADVTVTLTHSPEPVVSGVAVTFTLTATNAGPGTASSVVAGIGFDWPLSYQSTPDQCTISSSNNSLVCTLGDIPAGSAASASVTMLPYSSGFFTIPAGVSWRNPDSTQSYATASDSMIVTKGPSQAVRYIGGIFPMIFDRVPNSSGLEYWANRWKASMYYSQKDQARRVPLTMMKTNEYRRLRIRESYQRILGRSVATPSLNYWVSKAARGTSYEKIDQHLIGSSEFARRNSSDPVGAVFAAVLGRAPSASEHSQWQAKVNGGSTLAGVASALQRTTEGYDVVIKDRFDRTLGELPTSLSRYIWQVRLREGVSPEQLWAELLVSWDVLQDYPYTDDDYSEYEFIAEAADLQAALAAAS